MLVLQKNKNKQLGVVLVTGLIFLLIAMLACISALENAGILSYEQGNSIQKYRLFYQLEKKLENLEQPLIKKTYSLKSLEMLLADQHIKELGIESEPDFLEDIWTPENSFVQSSGTQSDNDYLFLIEYVGNKNRSNVDATIEETLHTTWLFRISVSSKHDHGYWLQSIVEVFPLETLQALNKNKPVQEPERGLNLDDMDQKEKFVSKRIAWYERIANE